MSSCGMKTLAQKDKAHRDDDVVAWIIIASLVGCASLIFYGSLDWQPAHSSLL